MPLSSVFPLQLLVVRTLIFFPIQLEVCYHSHLLTWNMEYHQSKYLETWFNWNMINAWFRQKSILTGSMFILDWLLFSPFFLLFLLSPLDPSHTHHWGTSQQETSTSSQSPSNMPESLLHNLKIHFFLHVIENPRTIQAITPLLR